MRNCRRPRKCSDSNEFLNAVYHYITPIISENNEFPFFLSLSSSHAYTYMYIIDVYTRSHSLFFFLSIIQLLFSFVRVCYADALIFFYTTLRLPYKNYEKLKCFTR